MKYRIVIMLALATALAACSSDKVDDLNSDDGLSHIVMPVTSFGVTSRSSLVDSELDGTSSPALQATWTDGDKLLGYDIDNATTFTLSYSSAGAAPSNKENFSGDILSNPLPDGRNYALLYPEAKSQGLNAGVVSLDFANQHNGSLQSLTSNVLVAWAKAQGAKTDAYRTYTFKDVNDCKHNNVYKSSSTHSATSDVVLFDNKVAIVRFTVIVDNGDENASADNVGDGTSKPLVNITSVSITDDNKTSAPRLIDKACIDIKTGVMAANNSATQTHRCSVEEDAQGESIGTVVPYSSVTDNPQNKSWGNAVYLAFPCTNYNATATQKASLTIKPIVTVTITTIDAEGNAQDKIYYGYMKEKTLYEGIYYRTTPIKCYSDPMLAQLQIAEWIEGGNYNDTQVNW